MSKSWKIFLLIVAILAIGFTLWYFSSLVSYIIISAILSIIGAPIMKLLKKMKVGYVQVPSGVAALITLVLFASVLALLLWFFAPLVAKEAELISSINVETTSDQIKGKLSETEAWMEQFNLSGDERSNKEFVIKQLQSAINFNEISNVFDNLIGVLGNAFVAIFSILFMTFFFLKDGYLLQKIIFTLTPEKNMEKVKNIQQRSTELMSKYLIGVLIQVIITSTIVSIGLAIIGIENALIIGLLAGIMNLVPYVGPIIGAIIGLMVALTTNLGVENSADIYMIIGKVLFVFGISQLVDNFFTQPFVLGKSVQAHPLEIFIVISAAATVAGIGGMIIAIPLYTILKIIASEFLSGFKVIDNLTRSISEDE